MLIDTHCHLDFPIFDSDRDRESILQLCQALAINKIVIPGICAKYWQRVLQTCEQHSMLFPALGLHPCFLQQHQQSDLDQLEQFCASRSVTAIGEIGLDYFKGNRYKESNKILPDKDKQIRYFSQQLQIAQKYHLPVLIHARRSHHDVIKILKKYQPLRGIIHAYSGSYEQAEEYLKLGFKLGFGGAYTYPKATKLRSLVGKLPLEAWVLETDAPDMSPIAHQGQTNSPEFLAEIAEEFVKLYDKSHQLENNSHQLKREIISQLNTNSYEVLPFI